MRTQDIFDNKNITANSKQLAILKQNFPQCFDKSGKFDIETLSQILGIENIKKEGFELKFLGKSYARLMANLNPKTLLMPDIDHNSKNENAQNLLIKGDNLEVLKHLKNAYFESIKMIYIDPPYNTGSDGFVYKDDRKFSVDELSSLAGISQEEAKRVLEFTAKGSNSHSAWLSFIYPRLYIARELLRDDGVIFISIDDNEQAQLKILCDEIFGEENFVANIINEKVKIRKNSAKYFSESHEYLLSYAKDISKFERNLLPRKDITQYRNPDNDPRGVWISVPIYANHYYDADYTITKPNGVILQKPINQSWRLSEENFKKYVEDNRIWWGRGRSYPMIKKFLSEVQDGLVPRTIFYYDETGGNPAGDKAVKDIFGGLKVFENPKPIELIKMAIEIATSKPVGNNLECYDIILDFFAGSGTTAHAVMAQNLEDGGNRKFILVQLDEKIDERNSKVAYDFCKNKLKSKNPTIFDITKERILRAAQSLSLSLSPKTMRGLNLKSFRPFHF